MSIEKIYNYRKVNDQFVTSGQPTEEQFQTIANEGFQAVINLATSSSENALANEAGLVREQGMEYYHIPVEWGQPQGKDFEAFDQILSQLDGRKTLIHCAANFRATAFYALYALKRLGWSEAQADDFRDSIWQGSNYPVWEEFIRQEKARIRENIQLRDVTEADLPVFFEQQLDPEATRMAAFPARQQEAFMAHWANIMDDPGVTIQTILFDGQVAGNIVSFEQYGKREVGYWLGKSFWGKGIATRALALFLERVNIRPLYGYVAKHNSASRRVLEKCGFHLEVETDEDLVFKLG
jgi:uncharacterized protein (TIGR01244 family)